MLPQEKSPAEWFWPTPSGCPLLAKPGETQVPSKLWLCLCNAAGLNLNLITPEYTSFMSVLKSSPLNKSKHEHLYQTLKLTVLSSDMTLVRVSQFIGHKQYLIAALILYIKCIFAFAKTSMNVCKLSPQFLQVPAMKKVRGLSLIFPVPS